MKEKRKGNQHQPEKENPTNTTYKIAESNYFSFLIFVNHNSMGKPSKLLHWFLQLERWLLRTVVLRQRSKMRNSHIQIWHAEGTEEQASLTICFLMNTHHWNLHSGCLTPGQPLWNCWRCGTDCPVQQGTAACSAGCWMLGTAGTSLGRSPPGRLYSVPADQGHQRSSALPFTTPSFCPTAQFLKSNSENSLRKSDTFTQSSISPSSITSNTSCSSMVNSSGWEAWKT